MNEVEEYILSQKATNRDLMLYFHEMFIDRYSLKPMLKYKVPFYYGNNWICYLNPIKNGGVELSFIKGYLMTNSPSSLKSKGRKMVKSAPYYNLTQIDESEIELMLEEAIKIDRGIK